MMIASSELSDCDCQETLVTSICSSTESRLLIHDELGSNCVHIRSRPDDKYSETGLPYLPLQMTPQL